MPGTRQAEANPRFTESAVGLAQASEWIIDWSDSVSVWTPWEERRPPIYDAAWKERAMI
jgi:hypothetical protein